MSTHLGGSFDYVFTQGETQFTTKIDGFQFFTPSPSNVNAIFLSFIFGILHVYDQTQGSSFVFSLLYK
jgi:hypothetical protein